MGEAGWLWQAVPADAGEHPPHGMSDIDLVADRHERRSLAGLCAQRDTHRLTPMHERCRGSRVTVKLLILAD